MNGNTAMRRYRALNEGTTSHGVKRKVQGLVMLLCQTRKNFPNVADFEYDAIVPTVCVSLVTALRVPSYQSVLAFQKLSRLLPSLFLSYSRSVIT